jgi:hypothetical protein
MAVSELGEPSPSRRSASSRTVGEGREPQAELVGTQGGARGAVGEQVELLFFDNEMDASR